ncbi:GFA family protein [Aureimonas frigidaquae]|uniref:Glutathione-dependent formaldehyde-activating GFA n=1 Tax=Aureimonas frigidaquae TaxID=424757 RepID=A0A0N7KY77_9HYPH|nr:GFA family protein [Aureimonas frigidaquae]BAT28953.1 glutathione-dependent formaldehyde-activating GFA [Aureimonas frigidaquae]
MAEDPIGPMGGGCLCGAVRFTATPAKLEMDVCHCGMCRKWSGGVFMCVPCGTDVAVEDGASLKSFASSQWGERVFCGNCGTSLFWRMQDGSATMVSLHAFDDGTPFRFAEEIFIDEKPGLYAFANDTRKLTGAQVMAAFASGQGS